MAETSTSFRYFDETSTNVLKGFCLKSIMITTNVMNTRDNQKISAFIMKIFTDGTNHQTAIDLINFTLVYLVATCILQVRNACCSFTCKYQLSTYMEYERAQSIPSFQFKHKVVFKLRSSLHDNVINAQKV